MRILFTGTRHLQHESIIERALAELFDEPGRHPSKLTFIHGGARGADMLADRVVRRGYPWATVEVYPAEWAKYGKRAGPLRNALMVSKGADMCLAFPDPPSRGTADCIEKAWRAGIPVRIYPVLVERRKA